MTLPRRSVLLRPAPLGGAGVGDWFCVTVVRPHPDGGTGPSAGRHAHPGPQHRAPQDPAGHDGWAALAAVAGRLGADPEALAPWDRDLDRFWDADDAPVLLAVTPAAPHGPDGAGGEAGDESGDDSGGDVAVVVLEVNGFEGTRPDVLARLSREAQAWSLFRGVESDRLSYAVDGEVVLSAVLGEGDPGPLPLALAAELAPVLDAARSGSRELAAAFALDLVERLGGVRLDDTWWLGTHLLAALPQPEGVPEAPAHAETDVPRAVQQVLGDLGRAAVHDPGGPVAGLLLDTLQDAVRAALHVTGLADDPRHGAALAQSVAEAGLLRKLAVESAGPAGGPDAATQAEMDAARERVTAVVTDLWASHESSQTHDPAAWHRLQAGFAAGELLAWAVAPAGAGEVGHSPADVVLHVRFALADGWPAFEDALAAHLEAHLG